ncbi:hypothetical protein PHET_04968 [Paragonimus heterotremus]|uniref:Uncharacterized protein n=1 Tax=Paragonimus heterotremus TaxID=100268 RepID=A0A8J4TFH2_9TREM|nr:hypothetical protein PHET_04968 [Paragonimus heterotremus]
MVHLFGFGINDHLCCSTACLLNKYVNKSNIHLSFIMSNNRLIISRLGLCICVIVLVTTAMNIRSEQTRAREQAYDTRARGTRRSYNAYNERNYMDSEVRQLLRNYYKHKRGYFYTQRLGK